MLHFLQGEHSKNFFQKEKVLYTSATKTGEFYLRLLCFLFLAVSALKSSAGEGTLPHVLTGREEHGIWWKEEGSQSPEDPAFLCIPRSAYLIGEVACFGVRDIGFRS